MARTRLTVPILLACLLFVAAIPSASAAKANCLGESATHVGTAGKDTIRGTAGDDVIAALGGADTVIGRGGNDIICLGGGKDTGKGGGGHDTIVGNGGNDTILLGAGDDLTLGGGGDDEILGAAGDDYFFPDAGNDITIGGDGFDQFDANQVPVPMQIDLQAGTTTGAGFDQIDRFELVYGTRLSDTIQGSDALDILLGLEGDDVIKGGANLDLILGSQGDDTLDGEADFDIVLYWYSATPVDVDMQTNSATGEGTDSLAGFESVAGSEFDDVLRGDQLGNYFFGEGGNDEIDGAGGFDISAYWFAEQAIQANLETNTATGEGTDTFADIEGVAGSISFGDTLVGGASNDYLDGDGGNDTLMGAGGDDWFIGGLGNDTIDGGAGTFDMVQALSIAPVTINLVTGTATGDGSDTLTGIESMYGTDFADVLTGNDLVNVIFGWAGNDTITAGAGDDLVSAGDGTDSVDGGAGTDDCAATESPIACEMAGDPTQWQAHPLVEEAAAAGVVREFARKIHF